VLAVAFHEASHALVGRYLGFEIGVATIVPSKHFGGTVRGPGCDLDATPADMIADARARCEEALVHIPHRGEPRDDCGAWSVQLPLDVLSLWPARKVKGCLGLSMKGAARRTCLSRGLCGDGGLHRGRYRCFSQVLQYRGQSDFKETSDGFGYRGVMAKAAKHAAFSIVFVNCFPMTPDTGVFRYIKSPTAGISLAV